MACLTFAPGDSVVRTESGIRAARRGEVPFGVVTSAKIESGMVEVMIGGFAVNGSEGGTHIPASPVTPRPARPSPDCHHCGAPPTPSHPVACRFCGTERP